MTLRLEGSEKQTFKTHARDGSLKGSKSPPQRKLQKQTSLKTFHTYDPEGSQKRLQNIQNSSKAKYTSHPRHQTAWRAPLFNYENTSFNKYHPVETMPG